jgi:hypothetical protein
MDKQKVPRLKATGLSPLKERHECLSDVMTNAVTPPLKSPVADSRSNLASVDFHQLSLSWKFKPHDWYDLEPPEAEELNLFDPAFGRTRQAISYGSMLSSRWSQPKLRWCAFCKGEFSTTLEFVPSSKTFWSSLSIFLAGGVCGCFMAPYYMDRCKKPQLLCSKCRRPV